MEKRGLLGAVAMAAVEDLSTIPAAEENDADDTSSMAPASSRGRRRGARQANRGNQSTTVAAMAPKAAVAVAEMLQGASECSDMDEIFKSLASVLADAQEESQQVEELLGAANVVLCLHFTVVRVPLILFP